MYRINKKILAIFLIAAFAQKLSIGLYLHNWLHKNQNISVLERINASAVASQVRCSCLDDALMPLIASTDFDSIKILQFYFSPTTNAYRSAVISASKTFHALRGPPHCLL
jgi:hypothetical protein